MAEDSRIEQCMIHVWHDITLRVGCNVCNDQSYEGGYKVMIIWMADKMNIAASNKLLKILEEPTDRTVFILITEKEEDLIQTIRSRC